MFVHGMTFARSRGDTFSKTMLSVLFRLIGLWLAYETRERGHVPVLRLG